MRLIFLRHGLAEGEHLADEQADFNRLLTDEGRERLKKTFKRGKKLFKHVSTIYTSPLLRASETAEILSSFIPKSDLELLPELDILSYAGHTIEYIKQLNEDKDFVFVGHEPQLGAIITELIESHSPITLKKGGICVLEGDALQGYKLVLLTNPKYFC